MVKHITLHAVPPFDFDLSASTYAGGDPQISGYADGKYWQPLRINGKLALATLRSSGTVDSPTVHAQLASTTPLSSADAKRAREILAMVFSLGLDLEPFYRMAGEDPVLSKIAKHLRGLKPRSTPTVFEALVDSIIEQQISLSASQSMELKLIRAFGDTLEVDGQTYYAFPTPDRISSATIPQLQRCGLSARKAEYIKSIARQVAHGALDLEKFKSYDDMNAIIAELDEVRGIGVWTAELTMIRGMGKLDAIPADDLGLKRCIAYYYREGKVITGAEARQIAARWEPFRGLAAFYLIVAYGLDVEP